MNKSIHLTVILLLLVCTTATAQNLGQAETIRVYGPSLEGNLSGDDPTRDVSVFLPPGYTDNPTKRYPVIYYLHGYGNPKNSSSRMENALSDAWQDGAKEMIMVMPHADTRFGGSMYSNSVTTGDWEAFVAKDLVAHIDTHYRTLPTPESRGLAGYSMGGYGALRIGMKYADIFTALYVVSPCCIPAPVQLYYPLAQWQEALEVTDYAQVAEASNQARVLLATAAAWSPNPDNPPFYLDLPINKDGELQPDVVASRLAFSPLVMIHQYIPQLKSYREIYMEVGDREANGIGANGVLGTVRELDAILTRYGVKHQTNIFSGGHLSFLRDSRVSNYLMPMFSRVLVSQ